MRKGHITNHQYFGYQLITNILNYGKKLSEKKQQCAGNNFGTWKINVLSKEIVLIQKIIKEILYLWKRDNKLNGLYTRTHQLIHQLKT